MSDLILEVTAGVGGQEAMLFTAEIFDMYQNYAGFHGWGFDTLEYMPSDIGRSQLIPFIIIVSYNKCTGCSSRTGPVTIMLLLL